MTGAAIYNHFSSKEELFVAVAAHLMAVNADAIEDAFKQHDDWRCKMRSILDLIVEDATGWFRYPLLTSAIQLKTMQNPGRFPALVELRKRYISLFAQIPDGMIVDGVLPSTASRTASAELLLAFTFNGLGAVMAHRTNDEEVTDLVEHVAMLLCRTNSA